MDNCSAKNCYLLTKTLYTKTKPNIACLKIACIFCHEMSYCCEECKNLDWFECLFFTIIIYNYYKAIFSSIQMHCS